jgi:hypothetical protein
MTVAQPYRTLSFLLFAFSAIAGLAGLVLIFATNFVLSLTPSNLILANAGLLLLLIKGIGIIAIALGYLSFVTARDPVRYAAVVDALIFTLAAAAILNVYGVIALHLGDLYPAPYLIGRATVQLIFAIVLVLLRPRDAVRHESRI